MTYKHPLIESATAMQDALEQVRVIADLERDAARYRFLRESVKAKAKMLRAQGLFWMYSSRGEFDKALDAWMAEERHLEGDSR